MSDQGFHEIQLSWKQLVFLFMSAVVVAVVIFLFGVATGRAVRSSADETPISADAGTTATVVPDDATKTDPGKAADSELSYHEMLLGAGTTPPPDPSKESAPPAATPAMAPPPVTPPAAPVAEPPAPTAGWFLQTGAYSTREVADGQVAKLKTLKFPAFVLAPDASAPTKLFRVRVGPYAERAEASQVMSRLTRQGYKPSITR
jgi:cell division protein FtsN